MENNHIPSSSEDPAQHSRIGKVENYYRHRLYYYLDEDICRCDNTPYVSEPDWKYVQQRYVEELSKSLTYKNQK